jgi:hypothetical protein
MGVVAIGAMAARHQARQQQLLALCGRCRQRPSVGSSCALGDDPGTLSGVIYMAASEENRALAKYLKEIVGGSPRVTAYRCDEEEEIYVDILQSDGVPAQRISTYSTLALSDHPVARTEAGAPIGVEILFCSQNRYTKSPNILTACGLNIIRSKASCGPGVVFPKHVELYYEDFDMKHILFVSPFLWDIKTQIFSTKTVAWLLALPISDAEYAAVSDKGSEYVEKIFEAKQIDIFDLRRRSVL